MKIFAPASQIFAACATFMMKIPPPSQIFAACASAMAYIMTLKSLVNAAVPPPLQRWIISLVRSLFGSFFFFKSGSPKEVTVFIEDKDLTGRRNPFYDDALLYFGTKVHAHGTKIRASREAEGKKLLYSLAHDDVEVYDEFEGARIEYKHSKVDKSDPDKILGKEYLQIIFKEEHRCLVLDRYLPYIESRACEIRSRNKMVMMYSNSTNHRWEKIRLIHPSTFETMAMSQELRECLVKDVDRFISRKEFYKKVGKAWKRGYLLYGPPGTGKSSLVAAMANHLNFDIYELTLTAVQDDPSLRKLLLCVNNGSILVVEDIDRQDQDVFQERKERKLSMGAILNAIDGLWCSCGEERIIVFTTNNKDSLDPALLRPGRMDMHIQMGYCTFEGFKILASNYLSISDHSLFPRIEHLINHEVITPAQVAGELMMTDKVDLALDYLVQLLEKSTGAI